MPRNKLSTLERQRILAVANSEEFGHLSPSQIVPRLADQGQFVGSESSFYRVLKSANQLRHRSASKPSKPRRKPRALSATAPAQLYCWDITYLPTRIHGIYFYLYLFLDIYSRKIVGWQVYDVENSAMASEIIRDICARENIAPNQVVLHSDNGSPMKGVTMLAMLEQLGVMPSFSRAAVSNDNPYSEALFKTLKYQSSYPRRPFENLSAARQWVTAFTLWYNFEHRHSAIKFVTPAQRHEGSIPLCWKVVSRSMKRRARATLNAGVVPHGTGSPFCGCISIRTSRCAPKHNRRRFNTNSNTPPN